MVSSKNSPQSSTSTLQVPTNAPTKRSLQPPSPSRTQPGFVVPPKDSRSALTVSSSTEEATSGALSNRSASPRPPTSTNNRTKTTSTNDKHKKGLAAQNKEKPSRKGKVSFTFYCVILSIDVT